MPQLTSSFASAAAGQNRDPRGSGRSDSARGSGSGEWPRSNGTRTFRRASTTPFNNQPATATPADVSQTTIADVSSSFANSQSAAFDSPGAPRYTREELLDIYRNHVESSDIDTSNLFTSNWNPAHVNGSVARPWGRSSDSPHVPQDPSVCWDANGTVKPIGLEDMSPEERETFATDVNSTLKPPQQNKDGNHPGSGGINGRKTSVSLGSTANHQNSSPSTTSRPGTRRRETTDTNPFSSTSTASPTTNRFVRDESWLPRKTTELKEPISDEPEEELNVRDAPARSQPFGLPRSNTTGASGFGGQSSLWGSGPGATGGIGAFGSFALPTTPSIAEKRFGTGGSRLAHLIPKDSAENAGSKATDVPTWRPRQRTDTDPFTTDDGPSGSAILSGAHDNSPPTAASQGPRGGGFDTPGKGSAGDFGMAGLTLGGQGDANGPASPSETNPYRSPPADRGDDAQEERELDRLAQSGPGSDQQSNFGTLPRSFGAPAFDGSDRSQTSSVGAKGFAGAHPLSGWPAGPSAGTPDRERIPFQNAFGGSIFSPLADLPSPGLGGLGGVFGAPSVPRLGRGKLESLFPPAMQAQMHGHDQDNLGDSVPDLRQANPLGAIGRGAIGLPPRDTGSPGRPGRGSFEDLFATSESSRSPFSSAEQAQPGLPAAAQSQSFSGAPGAPSFPPNQSGADPTVVRTMVMPDRMRWVYLDPQGTMQGPFSGLEMNDWYKANFFTPDLRVKRLEDPDFEPLGQLIRRIGNSREPFLVPQMGIPHGPPPAAGPFTSSSEAIPPLQSAFPSFGRTLTAQQQNDLERRKQEEQMFHARQRELAQHHHPAFSRLPPIQPGVSGALHHHSSAHSLQSQPSFGSMASPIVMTPQHPLGPIAPGAGFFDTVAPMAPGPAQAPISAAADLFAPDLNFSERQMLANMQGLPGIFPSAPAIGAPAGDSSVLRGQLPRMDQLQKDEEGFSARLKEFHDLRAQFDAEEAVAASGSKATPDVKEPEVKHEEQAVSPPAPAAEVAGRAKELPVSPPEASTAAKHPSAPGQPELSLTEKVRKTQAEQPALSDLPMPFPPPAQAMPLAAPTAQRPASILPTRYGERSASGTPDTASDAAVLAAPPTAPWAPQPGAEMQKGPSLKEIQEAEAKRAAKKEEAAAAARKAALEQEAAALREREKAAAAAANSGLPATSTWGTGSPVAAPSGSPWKQPAALKSVLGGAGPGPSGSKKTLADIQREEEARKQKAREAAAQANTPPASAMAKRYADLAGKGSAPPGSMAAAAATQAGQGGGWATVGAGGKVKIPTGPAVQNRSVSASNVKTAPAPVVAKPPSKPGPTSLKDAKNVAMDEFKKWLHRELGRGLIGVADIEQFAATLLEMPLDPSLLAEAVYSYSTTMDGRHFADEFVRRKKLADKGIVEKEPAGSSANDGKSSSGGGWSEVAKKGGGGGSSSSGAPKDDNGNIPGFRVVPSKKNKGKK